MQLGDEKAEKMEVEKKKKIKKRCARIHKKGEKKRRIK